MAAGLAERILARGLPASVASIAVEGGARVHPALAYRAQAVSPSALGPAWTVVDALGTDAGLLPLWSCGTTTVFSAPDTTFLAWDAEEDAPFARWPDFAGAAQGLLADLWEDETSDDELEAVARLLLPDEQVAAVLTVLER